MTSVHSQNFSLKWDRFQSTVTSALDALRLNEEFVDVTLCCRGERVRAHRIILSACSPYFRDVLNSINHCQHLVLFLNDVSPEVLRALVNFMYCGHVNVAESQLPNFLRLAEMLQIRGLYGNEAGADGVEESSLNISSFSGRLSDGDMLSGESVAAMAHVSLTLSDHDQQQQREHKNTHSHMSSSLSCSGSNVHHQHLHRDTTSDNGGASQQQQCGEVVVGDQQIKFEVSDEAVESAELSLGEFLNSNDVDCSAGSDLFPAGEEAVGMSSQEASDLVSAQQLVGTALPGTSRRISRTSPSSNRHSFSRILCAVCGKAYANRGSLKMHMKTHQGMTKCRECGRVFSMVHHLRLHLRRVHGFTDQQVRLVVPTRVRFKTSA